MTLGTRVLQAKTSVRGRLWLQIGVVVCQAGEGLTWISGQSRHESAHERYAGSMNGYAFCDIAISVNCSLLSCEYAVIARS